MKLSIKSLFITTVLTVSSVFAGNVDLEQSNFKWNGSKITGSKHFGKVPMKSANVVMKDGKLTGGTFVADIAGITTDDLDGMMAKKLIGHLKSKDFFVVEEYPTSTLKIKSVKGNTVTADLTVKDKTNEVKFDVKKVGKKYSGVLKFDRTKFGMIYGSGDFFKNLGDKVINNEVSVDFTFVVK